MGKIYIESRANEWRGASRGPLRSLCAQQFVPSRRPPVGYVVSESPMTTPGANSVLHPRTAAPSRLPESFFFLSVSLSLCGEVSGLSSKIARVPSTYLRPLPAFSRQFQGTPRCHPRRIYHVGLATQPGKMVNPSCHFITFQHWLRLRNKSK